MNETGNVQETEIIFRRLTESFKFAGREQDPRWWLAVLIPVLILGMVYVVHMYRRDARGIGWRWASFLGLLRLSVYAILGFIFLLPSKQTYDKVDKHSRVVLVLDVSDSMNTSDDPPSDAKARTHTRLQKVIDALSDDKVAFIRKILDKNPLFVYRLGSKLDEESQAFEKRTAKENSQAEYGSVLRTVALDDGTSAKEYGPYWKEAEWSDYAKYNFKPWILKGLSPEGRAKLKEFAGFGGDTPGTVEWAKAWLDKPEGDRFPADLNPADTAYLKGLKPKLEARMDLARAIGISTNVPDAVLTALNREAANMLQGIVVISDGRSNAGSDSTIAELRSRAKNAQVPIFTIGVGEDRQLIALRITDVQAPDQTPPDEPFKIIVEVDGEGLTGQTVPITLEMYPPKSETPFILESKVTFAAGEPPHGQVEIAIDPEKMPETLKTKPSNFRDLVEGEWRIVATTPRLPGEKYEKPKHTSEPALVKVEKKPMRILIMASGPSRDYQFLINQLIRDQADLSVYLQNEGGAQGKIALLDDPSRMLTHFPTRLRVEDDPTEAPDEKWYNLGKYDVIIAFDPDWDQLSAEQMSMLETWVNLQAGGLMLVAGPIYTKKLNRQDENSKYRPLLDIYPLQPGDADLLTLRDVKEPFALKFVGVNPETDFLKLDDEKDGPTAGWDQFFYGKDNPPEGIKPIRGFYNFFPVKAVKPAATVVATYADPKAKKTDDGKDQPFLVTMRWGQGMTAFIGSSEIWRLREVGKAQSYFERFWIKMARNLSSGSRRKQNRRGRLLMGKEFTTGSYIRVSAQLLDASLKPLAQNAEPKMTIQPIELDSYAEKDHDKENKKYAKEYRLSAKKGAEDWAGMFQRQILAAPETFPPGQYRVDVSIPDSSDTLRSKFTVRRSNPELDNLRPDYAALAAMAGEVSEIQDRVENKGTLEAIRQAATRAPDGLKLAFKFDNKAALDLIPDCLLSVPVTTRNRGAVEDLWDKGPELPTWMTHAPADKPARISWLLLVAVGLLSIEWLTRKLLRLA